MAGFSLNAVHAAILVMLGTGLASAEPTIFHVSDPVGPGDSVFVAGAGLASTTNVAIWPIPGKDGSPASGESREARVIRSDARSLLFAVPQDLPSGTYGFSIRAQDGVAKGVLNAPTVYWSQSDRGRVASQGGWIRVVGRNIARSADARLELSHEGAAVVRLAPSRFDVWDASFAVPSDIEPGTYSLNLSNGDAGGTIWRNAGAVTIAASGKPRTEATISITDFGAVGDGKTDASDAVDAALAAAAAKGNTVAFPQGTFLLSRTIQVPDGVAFAGEGMDRTILLLADLDMPPDPLINAGARFALRDLSIVARRHLGLVRAGAVGDAAGPEHGVTIERVRIRASAFMKRPSPEELQKRLDLMMTEGRGAPALLLTGHNIRVSDCDIVTSMRSIFLVDATDAVVSGNHVGNGRRGWYSISRSNRVLMEDNDIFGADLQASGGGLNTLAGDEPRSQNILVRNNTFRLMFGGDREPLTTDGPGGFYYGPAISTTPRSVRIGAGGVTSSSGDWSEAAFYVVAGEGAGQYARVAAFRGGAVDIDRDLAVPLDSTSVISIVPAQENYVIVGNTFEDTGALQTYGGSMDTIFAGNRMRRSIGIIINGGEYRNPQPSWYAQVLNNVIESANGFTPTVLKVGAWSRTKSPLDRVLTFGTIVRGNRLGPMVKLEVSATRSDFPLVDGTIVERNELADGTGAVAVTAAGGNVTLRDNAPEGGLSGLSD